MKLGDLVEKVISIITLGQGKKIATYIAKLRGQEDCGCDKRKEKLNNINFNINPMSNTKFTLKWSQEDWDKIRSQVSCSCQFDYAFLYVQDKSGNVFHEEKISSQPHMNGQIKSYDVSFPTFLTPHTFSLLFHKKEGGFIKEIKVKI
jgi:hypothetical protein